MGCRLDVVPREQAVANLIKESMNRISIFVTHDAFAMPNVDEVLELPALQNDTISSDVSSTVESAKPDELRVRSMARVCPTSPRRASGKRWSGVFADVRS
jgi:hypothetical protein